MNDLALAGAVRRLRYLTDEGWSVRKAYGARGLLGLLADLRVVLDALVTP